MLNLTERLGVEHDGGSLRIGFVNYNTEEEVERMLDALKAAENLLPSTRIR